jgi:hypothetical protein
LEDFFKAAGISPLLSDSIRSEFTALPDQNSIESCLAHVRSCDHFILVLSKRYGPRLGNAGFENVSATHLEYCEAVKNKKPIYVYVRDRLEADFASWRKNKEKEDFQPLWTTREELGLFHLLKEARNLEGQRNNWIWTFRNSVELKARLAIDFKDVIRQTNAARLFQSGNIPHLHLNLAVKGLFLSRCSSLAIDIHNLGRAVAINLNIETGRAASMSWQPFESIGVGQTKQTQLQVKPSMFEPDMITIDSIVYHYVAITITFSTLDGFKFKQIGKMQIVCNQSDSIMRGLYCVQEVVYVGPADLGFRVEPEERAQPSVDQGALVAPVPGASPQAALKGDP